VEEQVEAVRHLTYNLRLALKNAHRYCDEGRKFDWEGNMKDWWTVEDAKEYKSRAYVMDKQSD